MSRTFRNPAGLHDPIPFGYQHTAAVAPGSGLVLVAGQYGSAPHGGVVSAEFDEQVRQAFGNVATALAAHGLELSHVVGLRTYVVGLDMEKLAFIGRTVASHWGPNPPTQTVIGVAALALPDIAFEVEAIAAHP